MALIQIHRNGLRISGSGAEFQVAADMFRRQHVILLEQLLDPGLLARVQQAVASATFVSRTHGKIGRELCMTQDSLAVQMLSLQTNLDSLFAAVRTITGCGPIGFFEGRIYRAPASAEFSDSWHSDESGGRQVGLSINLGPEVYQGGLFELREGEAVLFRAANTVPGNALLFRIRAGLQHRVKPVEGTTPKTAYAGWFIEEASSTQYIEILREMRDRS